MAVLSSNPLHAGLDTLTTIHARHARHSIDVVVMIGPIAGLVQG